ncbi:hypothetical protein HN51_061258 [Arachis hypogaea]
MAGISLLLDLWRKNQNFNTARNYQSSWFISASATTASFAVGSAFASKDFFGFRTPVIAYCDVGAATSEDYIPTKRSVPERYFYHDTLKYTTAKNYNIELKPLSSAFELWTFGLITLRSFLMFYLPLLEPHAKMEQDDHDYLQTNNQDTFCRNLSVPFKKSLWQIVREVTVLTTRRILERVSFYYLSRRMAWKLLKDVPASATRKAARKMPTLVYFLSVTRTTFRGYILGVAASWIVQIGSKLCQFGISMCPCKKVNDNNIEKCEKIRQLKQKVFVATVKCSASLVFASIGAGIGATLFKPSTGQWIGCIIGDLAGPVIVAVCADKVFHLNLN